MLFAVCPGAALDTAAARSRRSFRFLGHHRMCSRSSSSERLGHQTIGEEADGPAAATWASETSWSARGCPTARLVKEGAFAGLILKKIRRLVYQGQAREDAGDLHGNRSSVATWAKRHRLPRRGDALDDHARRATTVRDAVDDRAGRWRRSSRDAGADDGLDPQWRCLSAKRPSSAAPGADF